MIYTCGLARMLWKTGDLVPDPCLAWNRIPDEVHNRIQEMALERSELSPRERAVTFTGTKSYFVYWRPVFTGS